jgi:hypothetical protein
VQPGTTETSSTDSEEDAEEEEIFPANDLEGIVAPVGAMVTPGRRDAEYGSSSRRAASSRRANFEGELMAQ